MKATFPNKNDALWPGLSVSTRLLVKTLKNVIVVPTNAVQHGPNGLYAFVVGNGNKVAIRAIKVGDESVGQTVVTDGLAAGERVVVAGQYRLTPGAVVDARELKAPPAASDKQVEKTSQANSGQKDP
jgi:multidrug efflux system membrane fusion protein